MRVVLGQPIAMLKANHEAVGQLFAEYEMTESVGNKKALVAEICTSLSRPWLPLLWRQQRASLLQRAGGVWS